MKLPLVLLIFLLISCRRVNEGTDVVGTALHLLNESRYDEAIGLLRPAVEKTPGNSDARLVLASAYAGSVGFNLIDSYSSFEKLLFDKPLIAANLTSPPSQHLQEILKAEHELISFLEELQEGATVIFGLPWVAPERRGRVLHAVVALEAIQKNDPNFHRSAVYRSMLFSLLFLNTLRDSLPAPSEMPKSSIGFFCAINMWRLVENVTRMRRLLSYTLAAVHDVYPEPEKAPPALDKIRKSLERMREILDRNRNVTAITTLAHGALRNEICTH